MVTDVEMECDGAPPLTSVDNLMVEASCCARYHGDGLWYRARVTKIDKPQNRITVSLVHPPIPLTRESAYIAICI